MNNEDDPKVLEAAEWLLRLDSEHVRAEDVAEWKRWLAADAANRAIFEHVQSLYNMAARIDEVPWPTDKDVAQDRYDGSVAVSRALTRRRAPVWAMAAAVTGVAIGGAIIAWLQFASHPVLVTRIGESRTFTLADGSHVTLGGASRVRLELTDERRALELEDGEAFFDVEKDPNRPFVVRAGGTQITAVGTAFNVRRAIDRVQVSVASGAVQVAAPKSSDADSDAEVRLEAGRQAVVAAGKLLPPAATEVPAVLDRKEGRLRYTWEPLRYVVADLGRYSEVPIEIAGERTGELPVTGTVLESDLRGWLQGLEQAIPVTVTFSEERITIRAR